ncbi:MAG: crossover junction endodeoxyribonuclease RuvC [Deltaproteobacteria bacterium]|nr:crossover junction endodeoxyribonuclease RuvC [Deltaproteobacteria bacterium]
MKVLGIDPGTKVTGYGAVEKNRDGISSILYGEIKIGRGESCSASLQGIYDGLCRVVDDVRPDAIAIEDIFYGKNIKSLIKQGQARGVAILIAPMRGIPIYEYTPLEIKKAVVGYGRAEKSQVQFMVRAILNLTELPPADAADALAVAICHAHFSKSEAL